MGIDFPISTPLRQPPQNKASKIAGKTTIDRPIREIGRNFFSRKCISGRGTEIWNLIGVRKGNVLRMVVLRQSLIDQNPTKEIYILSYEYYYCIMSGERVRVTYPDLAQVSRSPDEPDDPPPEYSTLPPPSVADILI